MRFSISQKIILALALPLLSILFLAYYLISSYLSEDKINHLLYNHASIFSLSFELTEALQNRQDRAVYALWSLPLPETNESDEEKLRDIVHRFSEGLPQASVGPEIKGKILSVLNSFMSNSETAYPNGIENLFSAIFDLQGAMLLAPTSHGVGKQFLSLHLLSIAQNKFSDLTNEIVKLWTIGHFPINDEDIRPLVEWRSVINGTLRSPAIVLSSEGEKKLRAWREDLFIGELNQVFKKLTTTSGMVSLSDSPQSFWYKARDFRSRLARLQIDETVLIKTRIETISEKNRRQVMMLMGLALILLTLPVATFILLYFWVSKPLQKAAAFASKIGRGETNDYLDIRQKDEIGQLSAAFNLMLKDLRQTINQKKLILDAVGEGILGLDEKGRHIFVNPEAEKLLGYQAAELIGRPGHGTWHHTRADGSLYPEAECPILDVLTKTIKLRKEDEVFWRKDGTSFPVEYTTTPILEDNRATGAVLVFDDITDRKMTELALKASEEKYRTLFEIAPISIMSFDKNGEIQFVNNYHLSTFAREKYSKNFFIGKKIFELPGLVSAGVAKEFMKVSEGQTIELNDIYSSRFSGGHSGYINLRGVPLIIDGQVVGGIVIREDVTKRKLAEEELRELNRALATNSTCHQALVLDTDESELLIDICRAIVDVGGYTMCWIGLAEDDDQKSIRPVAAAGQGIEYLKSLELTWADEERGRGPSGTAIRTCSPVMVTDIESDPEFISWRQEALKYGLASTVALPLVINERALGVLRIYCKDPDAFKPEEVDLMAGLANDVAYGISARRVQAHRKKMEEEREKLETQLRQAQKMESLGTLAGGIAHDFNNILGAILGYAQIAQLEALPDSKIGNYLEHIIKAGNRAAELVRHILTFSHQTDQKFVPIELGPIIVEALKLLRASLPSSIEMDWKIADDERTVLVNPTQIHQVLLNLCTNAAYAMGEKGGRLSVELDEVEIDDKMAVMKLNLTPGKYLRLRISDTGHGINPKILDRIFDPYFTTKEPSQGTGLGLAIVHGIVKSHRGAISVYSEPGQGSTFNVFLPMIDEKFEAERAEADLLESGTERILFIDDEPDLVELATAMLDKLGYQVTAFTSSIDALEAFSRQPQAFDLVITDQTMPHLVGLDLSRELLKIRPEIPIILCTGYSAYITQEKATALGIKGLVYKPILISDLSKVIRKALAE